MIAATTHNTRHQRAGFFETKHKKSTGYMTSEEFRIGAIAKVNQFCGCEQVLVLPDWQKNILRQRLEDVKNGNTISQEEAHKIFEQYV